MISIWIVFIGAIVTGICCYYMGISLYKDIAESRLREIKSLQSTQGIYNDEIDHLLGRIRKLKKELEVERWWSYEMQKQGDIKYLQGKRDGMIERGVGLLSRIKNGK